MREIDPELKKMSDGDLELLRNELYGFAQLAFEAYWARKYGSKNPTGLFPHVSQQHNI